MRLGLSAYWAVAICLFVIVNPHTVLAADIRGGQDHPLLTRFPGTTIVGYDSKAFDTVYIHGSPQMTTGKVTWIAYQAPSNVSALQLYRNYETALSDGGFNLLQNCRKEACEKNMIGDLVKLNKRDITQHDRWMRGSGHYLSGKKVGPDGDIFVAVLVYEGANRLPVIRLFIVEPGQARHLNDLGGRVAGSKKLDYEEAKFAAGQSQGNRLANISVFEGRLSWQVIGFPNRHVSAYEAFTSVFNVIRGLPGGRIEETVFSCVSSGCGNNFIKQALDLNGWYAQSGERWSSNSGIYGLAKFSTNSDIGYVGVLAYTQPDGRAVVHSTTVVTGEQSFDQIKFDAAALADEIDRSGRVSVYGIYFDLDKALIKSESETTLLEIAKLLSNRPDLTLYVDGHTDDQGEKVYNLNLSKQRAAAVVEALETKHGVDSGRLEPRGFGESQPVADNQTSEGRGENRRVELVAKSSDQL